jgi:hypothetical protein
MKRSFALLVPLLTVLAASAQYTVRWMRPLEPSSGTYARGEDLIVSDQGRLCINGVVSTTGLLGGVIVNYDTAGVELWGDEFGGVVTAEAWRLFLSPSDQWITAGFYEDGSGTNDIYYTAYAQDGDSVSGGEQASAGFAASDDLGDAVLDSQGNVYLGGSGIYPNARATLTRFDAGGLFRWTSEVPYFTGTSNTVIGIEMARDARIVSTVQNSTGYGTIACHDSLGNLLWRSDSLLYAPEFHTSLATDASGNAIAGGRSIGGYRVVKLNTLTGDTLWTRYVAHPGVPGVNGTIQHVLTDGAGAILAVGTDNTHVLVAKLSAAGDVLWTDTLPPWSGGLFSRNAEHVHLQDDLLTLALPGFNSRLYRYDLNGVRLMDTPFVLPGLHHPEISAMHYFAGDLYITGSSSTTAGGGGSGRLGFTARLGMPSVPTGVQEVRTAAPVTLYPDPADDLIHLPGYTGTRVTVRDLTGRVCLQQTIDGGAVDISHLPAGTYVVMPDGTTTGKQAGRFIKR